MCSQYLGGKNIFLYFSVTKTFCTVLPPLLLLLTQTSNTEHPIEMNWTGDFSIKCAQIGKTKNNSSSLPSQSLPPFTRLPVSYLATCIII